MANITDLTGYTWTAKDVIDYGILMNYSFELNFKLNDSIAFSSIAINEEPEASFEFKLFYDATKVYDFDANTWTDSKYKVITFTGGKDATDFILIDWFTQNGTLTKGDKVNDLIFFTDSIEGLYLGDNEVEAYLGDTKVYG